MFSVRRASRCFGSALLLSVTLASQVHAMPVIGELQRLQTTVRQEESQRNSTDAQPGAKEMGTVDRRKASVDSSVESTGPGLLRLNQQTLILVVAGFAAALSLMARLR